MELLRKFYQLAALLGQPNKYETRPPNEWDVCRYGDSCDKEFGACQISCQTCGCHNQIGICVIENNLIKRFCDLECAELWVDLRLTLHKGSGIAVVDDIAQESIEEAWRKGDPVAVKEATSLAIQDILTSQ